MAEKFCLKWNDFQTNVSNTFRKLRTSDNFYDVTLVSDDQQQVSAHKVVLSSSSEYFRNVLTSNKHAHPLLCLNGVNKGDLENILDFIYNGEIQIFQDQLDQFLEIAQRFQVEGLLQGEKENEPEPEQVDSKQFPENNFLDTFPVETGRDIVKTQTQRDQKLIVVDSANFGNLNELDQKINEMFEKIDGGGQTRRCIPCGKITRDTCNAREHAETHIDGLNFPCQFCEKTFRSRNSLRSHTNKRLCMSK